MTDAANSRIPVDKIRLIDSVRALPKEERYNVVAIKENFTEKFFNGIEGIATRKIRISGVKLIWDKNDLSSVFTEGEVTKNLCNFSGSADIEILEMYADEVIIRSPLSFPQTAVHIYARKLTFQRDGSITTTPLEHKVDTAYTNKRDDKGRPLNSNGNIQAADGLPGFDGGNIYLNLKEGIFVPNGQPRFITCGSKGQKAEDGGYLDFKPKPGQSGIIGDPNSMIAAIGSNTPPSLVSWLNFDWDWPDYQSYFDKYAVVYLRMQVYDDSILGNPHSRNWVEEAGTKLWPSSGPDAFPSGKPGDGGNAGDLVFSSAQSDAFSPSGRISIDKILDASPGPAASPSKEMVSIPPQMPLAGREAYVFLYMSIVRFWVSHTINESHKPKISVEKAPMEIRAGNGCPTKNGEAGRSGNAIFWGTGNDFQWLHPGVTDVLLRFAKDAYLAGHRDVVERVLEPYRTALDEHLQSKGFLPNNLKALRTEIDSLLAQIKHNLDFYGNPPGWLPRLSVASNMEIFMAEKQTALKLYYYGYALEKKWEQSENQGRMLTQNIQALNSDVSLAQKAIIDGFAQLNNSRSQLDTIQSATTKLKQELLEINRSVNQYAEDKAKEQAIFTGVFQIAASVCRVIPVGQPYLGSAGGGLLELVGDIDINNSDAVEEAFKFGKDFGDQLSNFITTHQDQIKSEHEEYIGNKLTLAQGAVSATTAQIETINDDIKSQFDSKTTVLREGIEGQIKALEDEMKTITAEARKKKELKSRSLKEELALYKSQKLQDSVIMLRKKLATVEKDALTDQDRKDREALLKNLEELTEKKNKQEDRTSALQKQLKEQDKFITPVLDSVQQIGKGVGELSVNIAGIIKGLEPDDPRIEKIKKSIMKSQFKDQLTQITDKLESLGVQKQKVMEGLLRAQDQISEGCATINKNLVKTVAINKQLQNISNSLDLEIKTFAKDLKTKSQERLRQYLYHFVKSYEYRYLKRVPENFFDTDVVAKIIDFEQQQNSDLLTEDGFAEIYNTAIQKKFSELANQMIADQQHKKPSMKNKYRCVLNSTHLKQLNESYVLPFNLVRDFRVGSFSDKNFRIISMAIVKLKVVSGYELQLISEDKLEKVTNEGQNLVVVAQIGNALHIRIFEVNGNKVVDKPGIEFTDGEALKKLKGKLDAIPDKSTLTLEQRNEIIRLATTLADYTAANTQPGLSLDFKFSHSGKSIILSNDGSYYLFQTGKYPQVVQDGSERVVWLDDDPISWSMVYNHADDEGQQISIAETTDDKTLLARLMGNFNESNAPLFTEHRPSFFSDITLTIDNGHKGEIAKRFLIKEFEFYVFFERDD
jgi:hypothetical protein